MEKLLVVIAGPTAVGKTAFSIAMAKSLGCEILSADSRQFYKEIPIGTAAPTMTEMETVKHHFVGNLSINDYYNVSLYEQEALGVIDDLFKRDDYVILTGGSGLYLDVVTKGIDQLPDVDNELRSHLLERFQNEGLELLLKELKQRDEAFYHIVDKKNHKRVLRALEVCIQTGKPYSEQRINKIQKRNFDCVKICLTMDRAQLNERINARTEVMMQEGFLEEAKSVFDKRHLNALNTVGYKELFAFLEGKCSLEEAVDKIKTNTRRYAKRQMTWLRKDESYVYFHPEEFEKAFNFIKQKKIDK